jgi:hypothetical protein
MWSLFLQTPSSLFFLLSPPAAHLALLDFSLPLGLSQVHLILSILPPTPCNTLGNIENTEKLQYSGEKLYKFTVTAYDCGKKRAADDAEVEIQVKPTCKPSWQGEELHSVTRLVNWLSPWSLCPFDHHGVWAMVVGSYLGAGFYLSQWT